MINNGQEMDKKKKGIAKGTKFTSWLPIAFEVCADDYLCDQHTSRAIPY